MGGNESINEYFEWLYKFICGEEDEEISYRCLFTHLHNAEFKPHMSDDEYRADDGIGLRHRFSLAYGLEDVRDWSYRHAEHPTFFDGPCTMLELLISVAIRCEEIACDPSIGDRTSQWFWGMVVNLGLGSMYDGNFNRRLADKRIDIFNSRNYAPNGEGGLFKLRHCDYNLRHVDIWSQMCWYLNEMT